MQLFHQSFFFFSINNSEILRIFSYVFVARNGRYPITNVARFTIHFTNVRMCVINISVLKIKKYNIFRLVIVV